MGTPATRRRFTREFKLEAVRQVVEEGRTRKAVAEELGLNANVLGRWVKEQQEDPEQAFPGEGRMTYGFLRTFGKEKWLPDLV